jgi:hypothetical protein
VQSAGRIDEHEIGFRQVARLRATVAMWEGKLTALEAGA